VRERCPLCGTRLDRDGCCPGTYELLVHRGERYGTAAQLVHNLSRVTMTMVRNWSRPDRGEELEPLRDGRKVYYAFARAAQLERDKCPAEALAGVAA
jgi:hypothetical protein